MIIGVGIGPGDPDWLTQRGAKLIREAEWIVGFRTVNGFVQQMIPESAEVLHLTYKNQTEELERAAQAHQQGKNVVVLFMGDPHFSGYQMIERLERACGHRVESRMRHQATSAQSSGYDRGLREHSVQQFRDVGGRRRARSASDSQILAARPEPLEIDRNQLH